MMDGEQIARQVLALERGDAFVDGSRLRKIEVTGADAPEWLNDLLTAGVASLPHGKAARSLLLSPAGHIRADIHVVRREDSFLLLQDHEQPNAVDALLEPYLLSSDVDLRDATDELGVTSVSERAAATIARTGSRPSVVGLGMDLVFPAADAPGIEVMLLKNDLIEAGPAAVDSWRIARGVVRFPVDVGESSIPAEGGLDALVDFTKGCFLGQESVAKVRNLGHPAKVVLAMRADDPVVAGEAVLAGGLEVGVLTSAGRAPGGGFVALARVSWDARHEMLRTSAGLKLAPAAERT